jgi:hypothetical protein
MSTVTGYADMAMVGGGVTVFFGPLRDDGTPIAWEDAGASLWFGDSITVEGRGDVDGDGFDDLAVASTQGSLVSCPEGWYDPECKPGLVYLVAGPQAGVVEPVDIIQGYGAWSSFGSAPTWTATATRTWWWLAASGSTCCSASELPRGVAPARRPCRRGCASTRTEPLHQRIL